jgi:hypothetical protein
VVQVSSLIPGKIAFSPKDLTHALKLHGEVKWDEEGYCGGMEFGEVIKNLPCQTLIKVPLLGGLLP